MFRTCVFLMLFAFCLSDRNPKPYKPGKPIIFPPNYCEKIGNEEQFDFIIVGGGPAGCTVARRLAEIPLNKVLLIEAGDDPPKESDIPGMLDEVAIRSERTQRWDWQSEKNTTGCLSLLNSTCKYWYGKVLGGSSVFNLMMYTRGNHDDYDEWKWNGNKGWGYNDILPYFKKLESFHGHNKEGATMLEKIEKFLATMTGGATVQDEMDVQYHGRDGPLSVSNFPIDPLTYGFREAFFKAVKSKNLPLNADVSGKSQIGFTNLPGMIDTLGYRDHVVKAYLQDIPSNLKICKNALVLNFNLPEPKNKKVQSVRFKYSGKFFNVSAKKEYILSAGGLGSPQILERSGIGIPDILQKAGVSVKHVLPGVGENLQDHFLNPSTAFAIKLNTESSPNPLTIGLTSLPAQHFNPSVATIQIISGWGNASEIRLYSDRMGYLVIIRMPKTSG